MKVLRGTQLADSLNVVQNIFDCHPSYQKRLFSNFQSLQLNIGGLRLPHYLENLGIFAVGSPGSGKSQAIASLIESIRQRPDFRIVCFDRNGEFTEKFFDSEKDLLFNPSDTRSVCWNHSLEEARPETIAAGIIPLQDHKELFWPHAARSLLSDLFERCRNNAEIWASLSMLDMEQLQEVVKGLMSYKYFGADKTISSIFSTLSIYTRFYRDLRDTGEPFSFTGWAKSDCERSLFLPLFEDDTEIYKPLYSMAFDLILKGLLTNTNRHIKTAVIIDELGALQELSSLSRLLSESRKFNVCPILATQTEAQIRKIYGDNDVRILLQGTATKLILNCRDAETAQIMADSIGKQERLEEIFDPNERRKMSVVRETYAVLPSQIQSLPPLEGYLSIADGTPCAKVQLTYKSYQNHSARFIPRIQRQDLERIHQIENFLQKYQRPSSIPPISKNFF